MITVEFKVVAQAIAMKKPILTDERFLAASILLLAGAIMDNYSSAQIPILFPNRIPVDDFLFVSLPYLEWLGPFSDIANLVSCFLLAMYLFPRRAALLPYVLSVLGLGYLMRSVMILLNPFGGPLGNNVHYGLTTIHQYGQFPSGHMFLVVAIFMLIDWDAPYLKWFALLSAMLEGIALIFSHGHYTIDVIGGWLLAYFCVMVWQKHKKELTI